MGFRKLTYKHLTIILVMVAAAITSCEDVIEVEAPAEPPRLIIDALIRVDTTQMLFPVQVRVRETGGFFGEVPVTDLKQITISNEAGGFIVLLETSPGVYERESSPAFLQGGELILQVEHKDQRYLARTRYVPSVPIDTLIQGDETLFEGDETELIVGFTDQPDRDDFYLLDFDLGEYLVTEDEFYQGQPFSFSYFYDRDLQPGQLLKIGLMGVDRSFYNYMNLLIQQSSEPMGPFQTPAATVRGNIINATDIDNIDYFDNVDQPNNYALGYFAVCQEFTRTIVLEDR